MEAEVGNRMEAFSVVVVDYNANLLLGEPFILRLGSYSIQFCFLFDPEALTRARASMSLVHMPPGIHLSKNCAN